MTSLQFLDFVLSCLEWMVSTLFESENEWQKTEQVPILLPRASRNFPDVKTRNNLFFYDWTLEIIPFICFGKQMDGTYIFFEMWKVTPYIVIQLGGFQLLDLIITELKSHMSCYNSKPIIGWNYSIQTGEQIL